MTTTDRGPDPQSDSAGARRPSRRERAARATGAAAAMLVLWTGLAAARPEVTYHLAPALLVWVVPWTFGGHRRGERLAATATGLLVATVGAGVLRAAGWLAGPVLFGTDAFGEAVIVALGATVVAAVATTATVPPRPGRGG